MLDETVFSQPMKHSAEVFPTIQNLLERFNCRPKEIEHVYISVGPGSFTGLRIAVTLAKMMNLTNAAKLVTVDTLDVIAANAADYVKEKNARLDQIATILDAKRGQFFIALYRRLSKSIDGCNRRLPAKIHQADTNHKFWEKIYPDSLLTPSQFLETRANTKRPTWLLGEGLLYYRDKFKADGIRFLDKQYWIPRASKVHMLGWEKASAKQFADPVKLQPTYLRAPDVTLKRPK